MNVASLFTVIKTSIKKFGRDETGATAIEYGLIAGLVSIAIIAAITTVGTDLSALFTRIGSAISTATGS